jgi:hypothetical protein
MTLRTHNTEAPAQLRHLLGYETRMEVDAFLKFPIDTVSCSASFFGAYLSFSQWRSGIFLLETKMTTLRLSLKTGSSSAGPEAPL